MAVALRELEQRYDDRRRGLRVLPTPAASPRPPRRVFWLRRALVLAVVSAIVVGGVVAVRALSRGSDAPVAHMDVTVVVPEGGTLWDLAERYAPAGVDRASWVAEVADRNAIDPAAIRPGTAVSVPVATSPVVAAPRSAGQP
ncbi:MAG TPA: hypothetical protein VFZ70_16775 [Euzebyales bacterium]